MQACRNIDTVKCFPSSAASRTEERRLQQRVQASDNLSSKDAKFVQPNWKDFQILSSNLHRAAFSINLAYFAWLASSSAFFACCAFFISPRSAKKLYLEKMPRQVLQKAIIIRYSNLALPTTLLDRAFHFLASIFSSHNWLLAVSYSVSKGSSDFR